MTPTIDRVGPLRGDHQGATSVTVFGANLGVFAGGACCWDHHPGFLSSQRIDSLEQYPGLSESLIIGGDGVPDEQTEIDAVSDTALVCHSYASVPGYTHTDRLLLSHGECNASTLVDTRADFQFYLDTVAMHLIAVSPRGGPAEGGTRVEVLGAGFGGRDKAMEFNSAWSQNLTEFEHQAAEIEEQVPYLGTILSIHSAASQRALC